MNLPSLPLVLVTFCTVGEKTLRPMNYLNYLLFGVFILTAAVFVVARATIFRRVDLHRKGVERK